MFLVLAGDSRTEVRGVFATPTIVDFSPRPQAKAMKEINSRFQPGAWSQEPGARSLEPGAWLVRLG